jgi:hypothetical protein
MYRDLGDRLRDGDSQHVERLTSNYDVIPYENTAEGGISYLVRGSAVEASRQVKRYR